MTDVRAANLNLLLVFDALIATGSVTRAAERVGLTQSGASNALAQLRLLFDDPLFERHGQGMRPTPRALEVAGDVRCGIEAFQRALAPRTFDPCTLDRAFRLAMPDALQLVVTPPLLARLRREAPRARLRVTTWTEHAVPPALTSGELDFSVGFVDHVPPEHGSHVLYEDRYACVLRDDHPALVDGEVTVERWLAHDHVIVTRQPEGTTHVDQALADLGLSRRIVVRVENALLVPHLLRATDLVALLDRRWATCWAGPGLTLVPPPVPLPGGRVRLVWHRRLEHDPAARWFRGLIADAVA